MTMEDSYSYWPYRRTTTREAFERGAEMARSKGDAPTVPYNETELGKAFVKGFETIRPWPYRPPQT